VYAGSTGNLSRNWDMDLPDSTSTPYVAKHDNVAEAVDSRYGNMPVVLGLSCWGFLVVVRTSLSVQLLDLAWQMSLPTHQGLGLDLYNAGICWSFRTTYTSRYCPLWTRTSS
jgi:hypothetical protein